VTDSALLDAARAARERAYAPYSHFTVGAALLCEDGTLVCGSNVENASFGLSMCAERSAVFAAVAGGRTRFAALAVTGPEGVMTPPCGACRQVLSEFGTHIRILYLTPEGHATSTVAGLLPAGFALP
jgi:cytidine deaminase